MTVETDDVKRAAHGRWREILPAVCPIDTSSLDGRHHPCPLCGGTDRFRMIDADDGAVLCNQCFSTCNGDGFAAVQHFRGVGFPEARQIVADHLGLTSLNGNGQIVPKDPVDMVARQKGVTAVALRAYGAKASGPNAITLPMYGPDGKKCSEFTIGTNGGKGLSAKGKPTGVFLPHNAEGSVRLPNPGEKWHIVEGAKDAAALWAIGFLATGLPSNRMAKKFARLFLGVNAIFVPDRDKAGSEGAKNGAKLLLKLAASVRVAILPAEFSETKGVDVREVLKLNYYRLKPVGWRRS